MHCCRWKEYWELILEFVTSKFDKFPSLGMNGEHADNIAKNWSNGGPGLSLRTDRAWEENS